MTRTRTVSAVNARREIERDPFLQKVVRDCNICIILMWPTSSGAVSNPSQVQVRVNLSLLQRSAVQLSSAFCSACSLYSVCMCVRCLACHVCTHLHLVVPVTKCQLLNGLPHTQTLTHTASATHSAIEQRLLPLSLMLCLSPPTPASATLSPTLSPTVFLFTTLPFPSYLCCHDKYIDIEHLLSYFSHLSFCFMLLHFRNFVRVSNSNGSSCCYYYKTTTAETTTTTVIIATITNKNTKTITTLFIGVLREVAQEV